jgi:hypothetical protein
MCKIGQSIAGNETDALADLTITENGLITELVRLIIGHL